ncbi:TPA: hypothetical protein MM102_001802 [Klebsiella variicola subsp. variicola]|uniref:hypothetical protein n=1 Tax=Klebsiella variicola TaxID=244366 RepID=UPI0021534CEE|nr:hypothetical protein [Klebsiella variicola]HBZ7263212.1 hypothetical protein [Klebsiella variicola subsp. variicola]
MIEQVNYNVMSHIIKAIGGLDKPHFFKDEIVLSAAVALDYKEITINRVIDNLYKLNIVYPYNGEKVVVLRPSFFKEYYLSITPERVYKYKLQLAKAELKRGMEE